MSGQNQEDDVPPAPPVTSQPVPAWPIVIGIIGIAVAGFHLLESTCVVLAPFVLPGPDLTGPHGDWFEAAQPPVWVMLSISSSFFLLSAMLLFGSIKLIRRKVAGARLCRIWSWIFLPWTVGWIVVLTALQPPPPPDLEVLGPSRHVGGVCGFLILQALQYAWPIVLIVWFSRRSIRDQVKMWPECESRAT